MPASSLSRIDLNLLVALQILIEERNVTRAAERMFVSQPAMSKTLQRLRVLFADDLFIRSGRELTLTPRAQEIEQQLPEVLGDIEGIVKPRRFDPSQDKGLISLATPEFIAVQVVPLLNWELSGEAPGFSLAVSSSADNYDDQMRAGQLDFALGVGRKMSREFVVTPLGSFSPAVWMRRGHPLAREKLTLDKVLEYPHIQYFLLLPSEKISPAVDTRFDKAIAELGLKRKKALVTDQLMTALSALQTSDCLMLGTEDDLKVQAALFDIVRKPYPPELDPDKSIPVALFQHRRTYRSPMHEWFKQRLVDVVERVRQKGSGR